MNGVSGACSRAMASAAMPSNEGIEKSERITSGEKSRSAREKDSSVSTMRCVIRIPARLSSRTSSSASVGTSSVSSSRMVGAFIMASLGDTVRQHPIKADLRHSLGKRVELHRLDDVAVHAEAVAFDDIALLVR